MIQKIKKNAQFELIKRKKDYSPFEMRDKYDFVKIKDLNAEKAQLIFQGFYDESLGIQKWFRYKYLNDK